MTRWKSDGRADMSDKAVRVLREPLQKLDSAVFLERFKFGDCLRGSDHLMEIFSVLPESAAIPNKGKGVPPTYQLTAHGQDWAVRMNSALSVYQLHPRL